MIVDVETTGGGLTDGAIPTLAYKAWENRQVRLVGFQGKKQPQDF
jgi:hypothetical protein